MPDFIRQRYELNFSSFMGKMKPVDVLPCYSSKKTLYEKCDMGKIYSSTSYTYIVKGMHSNSPWRKLDMMT
jgi:hypothetical protein